MKKIRALAAPLAAILLGLILVVCQQQGTQWRGEIREEGGIILVNNPKKPMFEGNVLEMTEDLVIAPREENEEQMFQDIRTLDVDAAGRIFVLDEKAANIKVFDSYGDFIRTIGKAGQGPGELGMPISIHISHAGELFVNDMGRRSLLVFTLEGEFLRRYSTAGRFLFFGPVCLENGRMAANYIVPGEEMRAELRIFDSEMKPLAALATIPLDKPPAVNIFVAMSLSGLRWSARPQQEIIWGDIINPEYVLSVHNQEGRLIRKIITDYDAIPITAQVKAELMEKVFGNNPNPSQWDVKFPPGFPPFEGLSCDDEGRIFAKTYAKTEGSQGGWYDIFDAEGRYLAKVQLQISPMIWKKQKLYTIVEDEEGFRQVKRYRVKWLMQPTSKK